MATDQAETAELPGTSADAWFTPGRFAIGLLLLLVVCFPQVLAGFETFFFRDYGLFGYPLAAWFKEAVQQGQWPLWNPYNDCGVPFLAQWNTLTLYPLSAFYLALPMPWSLSAFCLGHVFLAGMGGYFLARRWTGNNLAAAVGGVAFAWNGLTWSSLMWPNNIAALGWMPWVVLAVEKAWREGGRGIALAALAGGMQMLAGAPEIILFTWVITGCLWLADVLRERQQLVRAGMRMAWVVLLVAGLAAVQLLPFLDLLAHSQRDSGYSDSGWGMPASGWGNYLVPLFHCFSAAHGVYVQHDQFWTSSYYTGVGIVTLALLAIWKQRNHRVLALSVLLGFGLLMAQGNNGFLYGGLRKIFPQLGLMRFPIKFVVLATFAMPFLAASGLAWMRKADAKQPATVTRPLRILAMLLGALIAVILVFGWMQPLAGDSVELTVLNGLRSAAFLGGLVFVLTLCCRSFSTDRAVVWRVALLFALWMDVFTQEPTLSPTVGPSIYDADSIRNYLQQGTLTNTVPSLQLGQGRALQTIQSRRQMYFGRQGDITNDFLGRRIALNANMNLLDHIPKLDGFYSLYLRESSRLIDEFYKATNDLAGLKDFLCLAMENGATNTMDWVSRTNFMPLMTAGQGAVFMNDTNAFDALFQADFDPRRVVILPPEASREVRATNSTTARVSAGQFTLNRLAATVESDAPTMMVIAQSYYHVWTARVDGKETKLWRANYAFQALEVPAGKHRVELAYRDVKFVTGGVISLGTLLICGVLCFMIPKPKKAE